MPRGFFSSGIRFDMGTLLYALLQPTDEHETFRINLALVLFPPHAAARNVGPILFLGQDAFF